MPIQDRSDGKVTDWMARVQFPAGGRNFSPQRLELALGPTQPPIQCVLGARFPGVKRPGHNANYPFPSSTEVKNDGAIPSLPHTFSWRGT
jgi:hypothetical protein